MLGEVDGWMIFEGLLRANFEAVGDADCCREDSNPVKGFRNLENGNWGRAEVGGGRASWVMLTSMCGSCEQVCSCSAGETKGEEGGKLLDDGPFVERCQCIPSCSSSSPEEEPSQGNLVLSRRPIVRGGDGRRKFVLWGQEDWGGPIAKDVVQQV